MKATEVLQKLDEALKKFGTYNYYDKGVDEVFNADPTTSYVKTLSATDAIAFLVELSKHEHGPHLVSHIISNCDNVPDEKWFHEVVEGCRAADLEVY